MPASASAALGALAQALGVPGPPVNTGSGLAYNLGATSGYQLTTDAALATFHFHPNTPVDETGSTPSVSAADQFVEQFLAGKGVPRAGGVRPLPELSTYNAADRRVFFQWTLAGQPVVNIEGEPETVYADVAANYADHLSLVGLSGAVPYGALGEVVAYPAMAPYQAVQRLNSGEMSPAAYILSPGGQPYPSPSPGAGLTHTVIAGVATAVVDSYGIAVPVYVFQLAAGGGVSQFVTCAPAPGDCLPGRFAAPTSPSPSASAG